MGRVFAAALPALLISLAVTFPAAAENRNEASLARLSHDIQYLASDALGGRGVGTPGIQTAAEYLRDQFKALGLRSGTKDGSFLQPFEVRTGSRVLAEQTQLTLRGPDGAELTLKLGEQYQPLQAGGGGKAEAELVFVGYGISAADLGYDDYAGHDVAGKIVVLIRREPQQGDKDSKFDGTEVTRHSYIQTKLQAAKAGKAAAVIMVNDPHSTPSAEKDELTPSEGFGQAPGGVPFVHLKMAVLDQLLAKSPLSVEGKNLASVREIEAHINSSLTPVTQPLPGWSAKLANSFEETKVTAHNVVAVLDGEGPVAEETIVVGAHYDHLGMGGFGSRTPERKEIHNGADDNATGTAAVVELARRFAARGKPARRMVFICFSGEERGLLGSRHYANSEPLFPLEQTVLMVNFDMIGHLPTNGLTVQGIDTGSSLREIAEKAKQDVDGWKLSLVGNPFGGSDHLSFYGKNIPILLFFTGLTKIYHTPEDDFETIETEGVLKAVDFADTMVQAAVALPQKPEFKKVARSTRGRRRIPFLGLQATPRTGNQPGLQVTNVQQDSPAEKAGLKAGDVLLKVADKQPTALADIAGVLREKRPGDKVALTVKRGEQELQLEVTLGPPR